MKLVALTFFATAICVLSCIAQNLPLVGATFGSEAEFTAAIAKRWPLTALESFCTQEREESKSPSQPPLVLGDSNWHSVVDVGAESSGYKVSWRAIVIRNKVEVFIVCASRGHDFWILEWDGNPDLLPYVPGKIPRLIEEGKRPNQALLPTPTAVTPAASHPPRQP